MKILLLQDLGTKNLELNQNFIALKKSGHQIVLPDSQVDDHYDADVLVVVNKPLDSETLEKFPQLKMVSIAFTGYDHVDIEYCKKRNIVVSNAAGYSTNSVAELTFGLILALYRKISEWDHASRYGKKKNELVGSELFGKTIGIIGTGTIGMRVAEIAKAFGCKLLGYSRSEQSEAKQMGLKYTDLETLLRESDIVTLHAPLNNETRNIINKDSFEKMKRTAYLIQTSRAATVNENDLAEALKQGKIAGAGVDVFSMEPPLENNPLLDAPNTVLSPHIAYSTVEALEKRVSITFDNIIRWIEGKPQNVVSA